MSRSGTQNSFDAFISNWRRPFEQIQSALDVLKSFPHTGPMLRMDLTEGRQLTSAQVDWMQLQPRLQQRERSFFAPEWVPIENGRIETFVDVTSDRLPVFTTLYTPFGGGSWKKIAIADSLRTLMRAAPRSSELMEMRDRTEKALLRAAQGSLFESDARFPDPLEARDAGFLPEPDRLFSSSRVSRRLSRMPGGYPALVIEPVSPLVLALFPPACELTLDRFDLAPTLFDHPTLQKRHRPRGVATLLEQLSRTDMPPVLLMSGTLHHPQFDFRFRWEAGTFTLWKAPYQVLWYADALIDLLRRERRTAP